VFTSKRLGLTEAQQAKVRPIIQEMDNAVQKIAQDDALSHEEKLEKVRPLRQKADKDLRKMLNDDQKAKLDQLEHQSHPDLHDELNGATSHH